MEEDSAETQLPPELAQAISDLAAAIAEANANPDSDAFWTLGEVSLGAILAGFIGLMIGIFVRRGFASYDEARATRAERRKTSIEMHDRFNSKKMVDLRRQAERYLFKHIGQTFTDMKSDSEDYDAIWTIAREYEVLAVAVDEGIVDNSLTTKLASRVFTWWVLHFRFGFAGRNLQLVHRLADLEAFFAKELGDEAWQELLKSHLSGINAWLKKHEQSELDFANLPALSRRT